MNWHTGKGQGVLDSRYLRISQDLSDLASAATARTNLGLGTIATQNAASVTITGGSISGITDLAIADGGTGQSTAQAAIDALTRVSAATDEHVLTKDTASGNAIWKAAAGGGASQLTDLSDVNTATPTNRFVLVADGVDFESRLLVEADISDLQSYLTDVVSDTTPQLGGNLDVNGNSIVSVSNGNIAITPDGTGDVILDGLKWPQADGTADYVLKTDGAGQLSWTAQGSGAPAGAQYLTLATDATLTSERVLTAGTNISLTDAGAGSTATLDITDVLQVTETTTPATPTTNDWKLYFKTDGLYFLDDAGSETGPLGTGGGSSLPVADTTAIVKGSADATKLLRFEVDGFTTGTTRVLTPPNADTTIAGLSVAQTFTAEQTFTGGLLAYRNGVTSNFIAGGGGNATLTGSQSVYIGQEAGSTLTTGFQNVGIGFFALRKITTGLYNVAIGRSAMSNATMTGQRNVGIGLSALRNLESGAGNFGLGYTAAQSIVDGSDNIGIGNNAIGNNNTTGRIGIGANAAVSGGDGTVSIGDRSGEVSGTYCLFLGYRAGQNETGSNKLYIANSNTTTPLIYGEFDNGLVRINGSTSATSTVVNTLGISRLSTGTPAAGFGAALRFALQSSTTAEQDAAKLKAKWTTATHATRQAQSDWTVYDYNAERTVVSIGANGSAGLLGFHAATPVAKQTIIGSRAGNAALADLLTKLATLGLITDSTTV